MGRYPGQHCRHGVLGQQVPAGSRRRRRLSGPVDATHPGLADIDHPAAYRHLRRVGAVTDGDAVRVVAALLAGHRAVT